MHPEVIISGLIWPLKIGMLLEKGAWDITCTPCRIIQNVDLSFRRVLFLWKNLPCVCSALFLHVQ